MVQDGLPVFRHLRTRKESSNYSTVWRIAKSGSFLSAMGQVFLSTQNSCVDILTPDVIVLGGGALSRDLQKIKETILGAKYSRQRRP